MLRALNKTRCFSSSALCCARAAEPTHRIEMKVRTRVICIVGSVIRCGALLQRTARTPHPDGAKDEHGGDDEAEPKAGAGHEFHRVEGSDPIDHRNVRALWIMDDDKGLFSTAPQPATNHGGEVRCI